MLRRQLLAKFPGTPRRSALCLICQSTSSAPSPVAKRRLATLVAKKTRTKASPEIRGPPSRCASTAKRDAAAATLPARQPDLDPLLSAVRQARKASAAWDGIPTEDDVAAALEACRRAAEQVVVASKTDHASDTVASSLLELDGNGRQVAQPAPQGKTPASGRLKGAILEISGTAYDVVLNPRVLITPRLLEQYVHLQARLGRPQTLPEVLLLYASKPLPRASGGSVTYVERNPNKAANQVDPRVAEAALDAAIEAKDMGTAVAIVEATYASKAFVRAKLVRKALVPGVAAAAFPVATYAAASNLSVLQNTMDRSSATGIIFAGILAYVGFTGAIGMVAALTANDHVKRVSWVPGTPLRQRFTREEERAALDKVACAFGFSEEHRFGEEEGAEFLALREYVLRRGMLLDAVEMMEDVVR